MQMYMYITKSLKKDEKWDILNTHKCPKYQYNLIDKMLTSKFSFITLSFYEMKMNIGVSINR